MARIDTVWHLHARNIQVYCGLFDINGSVDTGVSSTTVAPIVMAVQVNAQTCEKKPKRTCTWNTCSGYLHIEAKKPTSDQCNGAASEGKESYDV